MKSYIFTPNGSLLEEILHGASIVGWFAKPKSNVVGHVLIELKKDRHYLNSYATIDGEVRKARFISYILVEDNKWCEMFKFSGSKKEAKNELLNQFRNDVKVIKSLAV